MINGNEIFSRARLLFGDEGMKRLSEIKVIVFGVGGVGSWCAEALVRTGVTNLTIVDCDSVCPSNINRQLMALHSTVGEPKVSALKERLLDINPDAEIDAREEVFNAATAASFHLESYDYIIDAIDSLADKALLILLATRTNAKLFSSMGAALKMDPERIKIAEFWKVQGCPLARALRQRFKKSGEFPAKKFKCVYSDELVANKSVLDEPDDNSGKTRVNGSLMHITSIFGAMLASLVVRSATGN
ncbi:MAG: tRNA threonylcarbamoyladenosine dehydratase [Paramuribaculum sp.]|nr:tRNA threonylcarbamoyladenosine dehydratase [Paramuribaculum sp.]